MRACRALAIMIGGARTVQQTLAIGRTALTVAAVMTTYNPSRDALANAARIQSQVDVLIVVDDAGSTGGEILTAMEASGAVVLRQPVNGGIAAALNRGVSRALDDGAQFIATFDQDSTIDVGYIAALLDTHRSAQSHGAIAYVAPEFFADVRQGFESTEYPDLLITRNVIQSGMLIPADTFRRAGLFDESLFIDLVDYEYELRIRAHDLLGIAAPGLTFHHELGTLYERRLFGIRLSLPGLDAITTYSTPFRYFYRVRNRLVVNRAYRAKEPATIRRDTIIDLVHFFFALQTARPRRTMWRVMRAGWKAGRSKEMGRMPAPLMSDAQSIQWNAPRVTRPARPARPARPRP